MRDGSLCNRASAEQATRHIHRAVDRALIYFDQRSPDFRVYVYTDSPKGGGPAEITMDLAYLNAGIKVNLDHYSEHPETIWQQIGHEVAHVITRELARLRPKLTKEGSFEEVAYIEGIESATTRLERMWVRDVPDPGWQSEDVAPDVGPAP